MGHPSLVLWGREFVGFERALARQVARYPRAQVDVRLLEISDLEQRVVYGDLATSGEADVLLLNTDWLAHLMATARLRPLDAFLRDAPPPDWPGAWVPSLLGQQRSDAGEVFGLPYHDGPLLVLYRGDLYEDPVEQLGFAKRYGYGLRAPSSWPEYLDQARWFTRPEEGLYGTILAGFPDAHNNVYDFLTQLWSRGGELFEHGRPALDAPVAQESAQFLWDLWHEEHVVDPRAKEWDSVASGVHFAAGEAAMMVNWCGFAALSADPSSPTHGRLRCAPAPEGPPPAGRRVTLNAYWVLAVPIGCRHPEEAYRLLRHLASPEMDRITSEEGGTGTRRDTWANPAVRSLAPYYGVLEAAHQGARSVPHDPRWPQIAAILNDAMAALVAGRRHSGGLLHEAQVTLAQL
ncbi:MAG: extracellular solute-binding protein [Candidatus Dormibacteria bacterium]